MQPWAEFQERQGQPRNIYTITRVYTITRDEWAERAVGG